MSDPFDDDTVEVIDAPGVRPATFQRLRSAPAQHLPFRLTVSLLYAIEKWRLATLAAKIPAMGIDASRAPVDDDAGRPHADLPSEQESVELSTRRQMRLPSAAERIEAHQQARVAADKAYAELIGSEISAGHAFDKHVIERGEFPGVTTREQLAGIIKDAVIGGESRTLSAGRTAYWSDGTVVIRDPSTTDGGTTFRPTDGYDYFLGLH